MKIAIEYSEGLSTDALVKKYPELTDRKAATKHEFLCVCGFCGGHTHYFLISQKSFFKKIELSVCVGCLVGPAGFEPTTFTQEPR